MVTISVKTIWIMATLMLIGSGSAGLGIYALQAWCFHFQDNVPVREQPHYPAFLISLPLAVLIAVLLGKYVWLFTLAPFARFDDAFLKRFYKR